MSSKIMLTTCTLSGGGAERVVSVWASELAENGYDVSVLVTGRVENEYSLSDKVRLYTVAPTFEDYQALSRTEQWKRRRRVFKQERPDYLISFLPYIQIWSLFTAWGLGIKRLETVRISPWHAAITANRVKRLLWMQCFKTSAKTILQSHDQKAYFPPKVQEKCVVIPNPIANSYVEHYKTDISAHVAQFIAAGRISRQKNYPMMIRAFAEACQVYPNLQLNIYGAEDGSNADELQSAVTQWGMDDCIHFRGRTTQLGQAYRESDVYLLSSDYEGMPNALMEAMASGLICIATDCPTGPRDLIDDGVNGFLVPVGDIQALTKAILNVVTMPQDERAAMGKAAREKVLRLCSLENSVKNLEALFHTHG